MLATIVKENRDRIYDELIEKIKQLPQTPYRDFAQTREGRHRIQIWLDNINKALKGDVALYLEDSEEVGYLRAHQGYRLRFIFNFYRFFKQSVYELVEESGLLSDDQAGLIYKELEQLNDTLLQGLDRVTASYLRTREDIIAEKVSQLQSLAGKMMEIQEEERRNLAGEIHDTITQSLTGIGYKIQVCQEKFKNDPQTIDQQLDQLLDSVHDSINLSREMISNLRPDLIDTLGLVAALKKHIHHVEMETGLQVRYQLDQHLTLDPQVKICLFRTVQEALMNVFKHSGTGLADLKLSSDCNTVKLEIKDEGYGFNAKSTPVGSGIGLLMVRERVENVGGVLSIESALDQGVKLTVQIPINREGV